VPAREIWRKHKLVVDEANAKVLATTPDAEVTPYPDFPLTVPCIERHYKTLLEICSAQTTANILVGVQNKLTDLDLVKAARTQIGFGPIPLVTENQFRGGASGSGGMRERNAYNIAKVTWQFNGAGTDVYNALFEPPKIKPDGFDSPIDNPAHIPLKNLAVTNSFDPTKNSAVINRLCDQTGKELQAYDAKYGSGRKDKTKESTVSKLEEMVMAGKGHWDKEDYSSWKPSLWTNDPAKGVALVESDPTKPPEVPASKALGIVKQVGSSSSIPKILGNAITDMLAGKVDSPAINALSGKPGDAFNALQVIGSQKPELFDAMIDLEILLNGESPEAPVILEQFTTAIGAAFVALQSAVKAKEEAKDKETSLA